jgi:5-methylcytosine-specific restriction endonuclease McrA
LSGGPAPDRGTIAFGEKVLALLAGGQFSSSYKFAVLLGLMDLCIEHSARDGAAPTSVSTRQLAERVLELYWPHTVPFEPASGSLLRQNNRGQAEIVTLIRRFREQHAPDPSAALSRARAHAPHELDRLVREIEWKLVEMPLPRLQVLGDGSEPFIYQISWDEKIRRSTFNDGDSFDNLIRLIGDAGDHLVRIAGLLRPFVQREWTSMVARFNKLPHVRLEEFLFETDRSSLAPVREPLRELAGSRCFYCGERFRTRFEVDHFIPWARYPDNGLENLVVSDPDCNRHKLDHLASGDHVERWLDRLDEQQAHLEAIAEQAQWSRWPARSLGVARSIYLRLPSGIRLWQSGKQFVPVDRTRLAQAFTSVG